MRFLTNIRVGHTSKNYKALSFGEVVQNANGEYLQYMDNSDVWVRWQEPSDIYDSSLKEELEMPKKALDSGLGMRFNSGKTKYSLVPESWTRVLAEILTTGAIKYEPHNWEKGLVWSEILDSLERHKHAWLRGETYDPETSSHHLGHVAWNALALMTMELRDVGKNDLHIYEEATKDGDQEGR